MQRSRSGSHSIVVRFLVLPTPTPALGSFLEGWRRVLKAPAMTLGILLATTAAALLDHGGHVTGLWDPSGLRGLASHPRTGWSPAQAASLADQLRHIAAAFADLSMGVVHSWPAVAVWVWLAGGAIERIGRGRAVGPAAFFGACWRRLFALVRLAVLVGLAWVASQPPASGRFAMALALFAIVIGGLTDIAAARIGMEGRRSATAAVVAAVRFASGRASRIIALWLLNTLVFLVILRLWYQAAPSAVTPAWAAWSLRLAYLAAVRLATIGALASAVVFLQGELGHRRP